MAERFNPFYALPGASAVGDTAAEGTDSRVGRADHRHSREAFATPSILLSSSAAAGAATTHIRADSTIAAFDITAPTGSAVGDTAGVGTINFAARRDHLHGREAYGTPVAITPDAAASAGTGTDVVRANHQHGVVTYSTTPAAVAASGGAGISATAPSRGDHSHAMGILTTRGDVLTRDATTFVRVALGSNGQVLQSNGTDLVFGVSPTPAFISMGKWYTD